MTISVEFVLVQIEKQIMVNCTLWTVFTIALYKSALEEIIED